MYLVFVSVGDIENYKDNLPAYQQTCYLVAHHTNRPNKKESSSDSKKNDHCKAH